MYCKKCGTIILDGAAFCPTCGTTQSNTGTTVGTSGEVPIKSPAGTSTPKEKRNIFHVIAMVFLILAGFTTIYTIGTRASIVEVLFRAFLFCLIGAIFGTIGTKKAEEEQNRQR